MPAPLAALAIPAAISAAGAIGGALMGNRSNAREAQKNRDFQERMSSTALTRARNDMMNAGINPAQLANVGGASTPGGAVASMSANPLEGGVSNARETLAAMENIKLVREQRKTTESQGGVNAANAIKLRSDAKQSEANARAADAAAGLAKSQKTQVDAMRPGAIQAQQLSNILAGLGIPGAYNDAQIERFIGPTGKAVVKAASGVTSTALGVARLRQGKAGIDASNAPRTTNTTRTFKKGQVTETSTSRKGATP